MYEYIIKFRIIHSVLANTNNSCVYSKEVLSFEHLKTNVSTYGYVKHTILRKMFCLLDEVL